MAAKRTDRKGIDCNLNIYNHFNSGDFNFIVTHDTCMCFLNAVFITQITLSRKAVKRIRSNDVFVDICKHTVVAKVRTAGMMTHIQTMSPEVQVKCSATDNMCFLTNSTFCNTKCLQRWWFPHCVQELLTVHNTLKSHNILK
jgi:hypothetical protein